MYMGIEPKDEDYYRDYVAEKRKVVALSDKIRELQSVLAKYESALELIAAPKRRDGTYNRCREACEILAKEALNKRETQC